MRGHRMRLLVLLPSTTLLAGCGLFGPDTYDLDHRTVQAEVGERFTLEVHVDVAMGEHWYMTRPEPDGSVVRRAGIREEVEDQGGGIAGGATGTNFFDFEAMGPGSTKIRLIECPNSACTREDGDIAVPVPSGDPSSNQSADQPTVHTYTVTVRKG